MAVPYLDVNAMADLADSLLGDPVRSGEIGRRAAALVRERFSADAVAPGIWRELQQHLAHGLSLPPERDPAVSWADIYRGWSTTQAPQPAFIAAHLARDQARRQAQKLIARGRRKEAVQMLVKAVSTDLADQETQYHNRGPT